MDGPLKGRDFTWSNRCEIPIHARLDRFLISSDWDDFFPNALQHALPNPSSNYAPILLKNTGSLKSSSSTFQIRLELAFARWHQ